MNTLQQSHFSFEKQQGLYYGKVRDVYTFEHFLIMVVSDRISGGRSRNHDKQLRRECASGGAH